MYNRCCVPNCKSIRRKVKMHQISLGENRKLWIKSIVAVSPNITDKIYTEKLNKLYICNNHFERRFLTEKNRVQVHGYPSLFTEEEIASGVPSKIDPEVAARNSARAAALDHRACTRRFHIDHTYVKFDDDGGDKWMEQLTLPDKPGKTTIEFQPSEARTEGTHKDHTYDATNKIITLPAETQRSEKRIDEYYPDAKDTQIEAAPHIEPVPEVEETFDPGYEDQVSFSPVPDDEDSGGKAVFSWQREEELIEADEPEEPPAPPAPAADPAPPAAPTLALSCDLDPDDPTLPYLDLDPDPDADLIFDPQPDQAVPSVPAPVDNLCKDCGEVNAGFDFWCVQCAGGALCGVCAGRPPHHAHYVLRAPMGCSRARTQAVLKMIRQQAVLIAIGQQLQDQNLSQHTVGDELKVEVKEEPAEPPPAASPRAPQDPLACEPGLVEPFDPVSICSPISIPSRPDSPHADSPYKPAVTRDPATIKADKSVAKKMGDHRKPLQPPRLRKPADTHKKNLTIPTERKLVKVSPAEVKRAFLTHIERVVTTQKQPKVYQPKVKLTSQVRKNLVTTQHKEPTSEGNSRTTRLQVRGSQAPMKVTSEPKPSETVTIDLDVADETVEYLEEGLESVIETVDDVDNHEADLLDEDDSDDVLDEDLEDLSDEERIVRNVRVKRKKDAEETLPVKGPSELMARALPMKAVIQVRPLSSLEIRNWTTDRKRLRKD